MIIEYGIFFYYLIPTILAVYRKFRYTAEELESQHSNNNNTNPKEIFLLKIIAYASVYIPPYFGAYYYADLKYIWLTLGAIYSVVMLILFSVFLYCLFYSKYKTEEYNTIMEKIKKKDTYKKPSKWQTRISCSKTISAILLWMYSWRHLAV